MSNIYDLLHRVENADAPTLEDVAALVQHVKHMLDRPDTVIHVMREEGKPPVLFGNCGGSLEYVSQRIEWRKAPSGRFLPVMIIRFTDHDQDLAWSRETDGMVHGVWYDLEFPIADRNLESQIEERRKRKR